MRRTLSRPLLLLLLASAAIGVCSLPAPLVLAVPMVNDPKGFEGIPWGAAFSETADFALVEEGPRVKGYELQQGPPSLGPARVDSMRFLTVNGQFARVTIRYHGKETHRQIVAYFQSKYGPLDRTPGPMAGGATEQLNWHGEESEINVAYEARTDRGVIFFESSTLASKFSDGMTPDLDLGGATY